MQKVHTHVHMYVCMYVCMYVYMYVCVYVCMYVYMYVRCDINVIHKSSSRLSIQYSSMAGHDGDY